MLTISFLGIIFVADVDRCWRLRLYFEQFGIRSAILNPELPVNSRLHVVEQFNKNVSIYTIRLKLSGPNIADNPKDLRHNIMLRRERGTRRRGSTIGINWSRKQGAGQEEEEVVKKRQGVRRVSWD